MTLALACSLAWLALGYSELPSFLGSVLMLLRAEDMRSTGEELAGCRPKATGSQVHPEDFSILTAVSLVSSNTQQEPFSMHLPLVGWLLRAA